MQQDGLVFAPTQMNELGCLFGRVARLYDTDKDEAIGLFEEFLEKMDQLYDVDKDAVSQLFPECLRRICMLHGSHKHAGRHMLYRILEKIKQLFAQDKDTVIRIFESHLASKWHEFGQDLPDTIQKFWLRIFSAGDIPTALQFALRIVKLVEMDHIAGNYKMSAKCFTDIEQPDGETPGTISQLSETYARRTEGVSEQGLELQDRFFARCAPLHFERYILNITRREIIQRHNIEEDVYESRIRTEKRDFRNLHSHLMKCTTMSNACKQCAKLNFSPTELCRLRDSFTD